MRHSIILLTVVLAGYLASSSPIDHKHKLVNRPSVREIFGARTRRSDQYVKGGNPRDGVKVILTRQENPVVFSLRKGEYICNGKVCQLKPGDKTCPVCQHPV